VQFGIARCYKQGKSGVLRNPNSLPPPENPEARLALYGIVTGPLKRILLKATSNIYLLRLLELC